MARNPGFADGEFARRLTAWQRRHGRHDLPWQDTRDPYSIWVSEIMLQQTQVATVIPYYRRFVERFPDLASLAGAPEDEVLALWSGLGYYSRARNLHRAARLVLERHGGAFPRDARAIAGLPGIGRSTAAAIAAFAWGKRGAILDGNVRRVLARCFGVEGFPGERRVQQRLWELAEALLPRRGIEGYTQALMDLGATRCTRGKPRCGDCPLNDRCVAHREGRTAQLPSPRPRRALPQRETAMLLLVRQGEILLEKRPPTGIWGGLWCLPETGPGEDAAEVSHCRFGVEVSGFQRLPALEHGFTHFRLRIHPRLAQVITVPSAAREPGLMWINLEDALGAALPAPVRKLIQSQCSKFMVQSSRFKVQSSKSRAG
ncbi:MAG TPA: A/G-specific adenine glycosylase, partial [Burkholderiales bacterium]|nr:A/G-specific adenine glycosylase [Burkholderiales bacterium]